MTFKVKLSGNGEAATAAHNAAYKSFAELDDQVVGSFGTSEDEDGNATFSIELVGELPPDASNEQVQALFEAVVRDVRQVDPQVAGSFVSTDANGTVSGDAADVDRPQAPE